MFVWKENKRARSLFREVRWDLRNFAKGRKKSLKICTVEFREIEHKENRKNGKRFRGHRETKKVGQEKGRRKKYF